MSYTGIFVISRNSRVRNVKKLTWKLSLSSVWPLLSMLPEQMDALGKNEMVLRCPDDCPRHTAGHND